MIQLDPSEPSNYFALAKIYEDAGAYDEAEEMLHRAKEAKPSDPAVYMSSPASTTARASSTRPSRR